MTFDESVPIVRSFWSSRAAAVLVSVARSDRYLSESSDADGVERQEIGRWNGRTTRVWHGTGLFYWRECDCPGEKKEARQPKNTGEEGREERKRRRREEEEREDEEGAKKRKRKKRAVNVVWRSCTLAIDCPSWRFLFRAGLLATANGVVVGRRSRRACKRKPQWFQYYSPSSHGARSILRFRGKLSRARSTFSTYQLPNKQWTNAFSCPKATNEENNWFVVFLFFFFFLSIFFYSLRFADSETD